MAIDGSGRALHTNGTATVADFQKVTYTQRGETVTCKNLIFRVTGAFPIRISFDNGNNYLTLNPNEVLFERWHFSHYHVQSVGGDSAYQSIGTGL